MVGGRGVAIEVAFERRRGRESHGGKPEKSTVKATSYRAEVGDEETSTKG